LLISGDAVVYFDLKHTIRLPESKNMHWILQNNPQWLGFIRKVTPFIGKPSTYDFVQVAHDMTPRSLIPGMSVSFIDYHLAQGNLSDEQVVEHEKSCIIKTTNGKFDIYHIGTFLTPLITLESLSVMDFSFKRNTLPKLRLASNDRFDRIKKVVAKLGLANVNFPIGGYLHTDTSVESLAGVRFQKRSISPQFLFGHKRTGSVAKQVLTHGAYKGCTRSYFVPVAYLSVMDMKEALKLKIIQFMKDFKQQLDTICPADDVPRHHRLEFIHSIHELTQLLDSLPVDAPNTMMLLLNADTNEQSYVDIRNLLFSLYELNLSE
jgi:hypothetical protein